MSEKDDCVREGGDEEEEMIFASHVSKLRVDPRLLIPHCPLSVDSIFIY